MSYEIEAEIYLEYTIHELWNSNADSMQEIDDASQYAWWELTAEFFGGYKDLAERIRGETEEVICTQEKNDDVHFGWITMQRNSPLKGFYDDQGKFHSGNGIGFSIERMITAAWQK